MILRIIFGVARSLLLLRRDCCCRLGTVQSVLLLLFHHNKLVPPNTARVILRARDYCVTTVIKCTREDVVLMPVQHLLLHARVRVPHPTSFIAASRDNFIALWIELNLGYLILVTFE